MTARKPSVEDAVLALAAAVHTDHGFQGTDLEYGHRLAGRLATGATLPPAHRRAAYRMLTRYVRHLRACGIELRDIAVPDPGDRPDGTPRNSVEVRGDRIFCRTHISLKDRMQTQPGGAWHKVSSCRSCNAAGGSRCKFPRVDGWHFPATAAGALGLHETLQQAGYAADDAFGALLERARDARAATARRVADDLPPIPGLKTDAWMHQRQAYWFGVAQDAVLLDMEMGTGKSLVAVGLVQAKAAEAAAAGRPFSAQVMCPERVVGVWGREFRRHSASEWHVVDGRRVNRNGETVFKPVAERVAEFDAALHECPCGLPHVCVANYAITVHEPFASWALQQRWGAVTLDEVHKIKQASGKWSRWCAKLGTRAEFRMGLTGTLVPHSPLDVFGPVRALDPAVFGTSETKFKHRYAVMGGWNNKQVMGIQPDREGELVAKVAGLTYRVGGEVLDLPDEIPEVRLECRLSPKARKVYAAVEGEMYAEVARLAATGEALEDTITADNVLVKLIRLAQITGGSVKLDSGEVEQIDTAKAELLADTLEDIDPAKPVIVFCRFHPDLDRVAEVAAKLGRGYGELSGRRADALTPDATLAEANADGEPLSVVGVQIQAGGTGIDFTRSHYAVYYSPGTSLGDYLQSRKRLYRPGQTESVRYLHLVASGTTDEDVYAALEAREDVAKYIGRKVEERIASGDLKLPAPAGPSLVEHAVADALSFFGAP